MTTSQQVSIISPARTRVLLERVVMLYEKALFIDRNGKRMPDYTLRRIIVATAEKAGMGGELTAHVFRRPVAAK